MPTLGSLIPSEWLNKLTHDLNPPIESIEDLLGRDSIELVRALKCSLDQIEELKKGAAWKLLQSSSLNEISNEAGASWKSLSSGIPTMPNISSQTNPFRPTGFTELDDVLPGGYPSGQIICFLGEGQSGKTQVIMTGLANAAMKGYCSVLIDTCNHFSRHRLVAIIQQLLLQEQIQNPHMVPPTLDHQKQRITAILAKISIYHCYDIWGLLNICTKLQSLDYSYDIIALDSLHHIISPLIEEILSSRAAAPSVVSSSGSLGQLLSQLSLLWKGIILKHQSTIIVSNVIPSSDELKGIFKQKDSTELQTGGNIPLLGVYDIVIKLSSRFTNYMERKIVIDAGTSYFQSIFDFKMTIFSYRSCPSSTILEASSGKSYFNSALTGAASMCF